jgi:hypothetical protein
LWGGESNDKGLQALVVGGGESNGKGLQALVAFLFKIVPKLFLGKTN